MMYPKTKISKYLLICAGLGTIFNAASALAYPDGRELLQKTLQCEPRAHYQGILVTHGSHPGENMEMRSRIKRNGVQGYRIDILKPSLLAGEVLVDDGKHFLHRSNGNRPACIGPSRAKRPLPLLFSGNDMRLKELQVKTIGKGSVAGRSVWMIEMNRPGKPRPCRILWIDQKEYVPLQSEVRTRGDEIAVQSHFERIQFDPKFKEQDFAVRIPDKVHWMDPLHGKTGNISEIRAKVDFPVALPQWIPSGFRLEQASVIRWNRHSDVVRLRYGNGLAAFTIFQRKDSPKSGNLPPGVLRTNRQGVGITIVSNDLAPDEEHRILDSIR